MNKQFAFVAAIVMASYMVAPAGGQDVDDYTLGGQQAKDKLELQKIKEELGGVRSSMEKAMQRATQVESQLSQQKIRQFDLTAREVQWEVSPGRAVSALGYNGQTPGPVIRVRQGDPVRVVVHNQLKVPTSLHFHGMILPQNVDGLPRQNAGLIGPNETFGYQFIAGKPGTYWYHPHITHGEQQFRGLAGFIIVEPKNVPAEADVDHVMLIGQYTSTPPKPAPTAPGRPAPAPPSPVTYFTVNGKAAPAIPPLQVVPGQKVRLRIINNAQQTCPLHLSGHQFRIVSFNGTHSDQPTSSDSIALQPGDRADLEFTADNPGVWSLSSILPSQTTQNGKFPGGIAMVLKYADVQ